MSKSIIHNILFKHFRLEILKIVLIRLGSEREVG